MYIGAERRRLWRLLTPEAFKKCLMRAQRRPRQKADPVIYCDYYLLLEKTYKLYTDYEKQLEQNRTERSKTGVF